MSRKDKKDKGPVSQSFIMGIIALVFLIIGYQTALMIHQASVTKIAANRDNPDTVFIYTETGNQKRTEIKTSSHSPRAEAIRSKVPPKKVESFTFDPNMVTVEDLCRLGLSPKQAQSIDNYRKKGGRFARKEDFKRSFAVPDSVYRRLQSYIQIPLVDLNKADSAAFDALPGIGRWYASKMIEYRERLGGYSYKEQLMDIWKFDSDRFDGLSDLIAVDEENVTPYRLWSLPEDSLRLHPYIGDYAAGGIVLFRENTPKTSWSVKALCDAGILNPEYGHKLMKCYIAEP